MCVCKIHINQSYAGTPTAASAVSAAPSIENPWARLPGNSFCQLCGLVLVVVTASRHVGAELPWVPCTFTVQETPPGSSLTSVALQRVLPETVSMVVWEFWVRRRLHYCISKGLFLIQVRLTCMYSILSCLLILPRLVKIAKAEWRQTHCHNSWESVTILIIIKDNWH